MINIVKKIRFEEKETKNDIESRKGVNHLRVGENKRTYYFMDIRLTLSGKNGTRKDRQDIWAMHFTVKDRILPAPVNV